MEFLTHENNVYAYDIKDVVKHISEVESGRRGYYCMGCRREMQAKKGEKYAHHFAHDPKDIELKGKCTFSDETHRHILAKETLQRIRQIRVPAVYKYPSNGVGGHPRLIRTAYTIHAARVEIELPFFENEAGEVKWGRNIDLGESTGRHLLIQPDVAFFNAEGKPILLIEVVATHKVDKEKLVKIWRLGIDTVQVSIPKDSPAEIENAFYQSIRAKWLYNNEQEQAKYLQLSEGGGERVPPLDEFQRQLLKSEESYACRASQLGNVIRAIGKCVGSEQYRAAQAAIIGEIRRVAENAERVGGEVRTVQAEHVRAISARFRPEQERLAREQEGVAEEERKLKRESRDLEERYLGKRKSITTAQRDYRPNCQAEIDRITGDLAQSGTGGGTLEEREAGIVTEAEQLEQAFIAEQGGLESAARREREVVDGLKRRRAGLPEHFKQLQEGTRKEFELAEEQLRQETAEREAGMRADFERAGRDSVKAVESEDGEGTSNISRRIRDTLDAGRLLDAVEEELVTFRRIRKAKAAFDSRAYKNWA
ncbi:competence protein CoiA family protein [Hymenobacter fodinae]|uniref:Competence protein CoiA-like N-terminal domain-containing protein n=1 Tax=Hymenobacter fodinae TaxID=2510796 RepID=A0A4Z0P497_9BACT|nr:competence protein CoiA family protein [Hymenobacter fodinae]TGE06111.1 hypothetical protein EU556_14690 [Hymenobacter fodinae]